MWVSASTTGSAWSYTIDTTTTFDGDHLIEARAVWGSAASPVVARNVVVNNSRPPPWLALPQPLLCGLAVAIPLAGLVLVLFLVRRRRRRRLVADGMRRRPPPVPISSPQNLERRWARSGQCPISKFVQDA